MSRCLCCEKKDAGHRYACEPCVNDMRRWLREMEDYAAIMLSMRGSIGSKPHGSVGVSFGSKPPTPLTPIAMLDPRSTSAEHVEQNSPDFDPVGVDEHDHVRSLPSAIHGIACWLREERDLSEPTSWTLASELRFLRAEVQACAAEQWVNELHGDLKELHRQARVVAKDSPPGPLGHCLTVTCDGTVFPASIKESDGRHDGGRCNACQRAYTGPDLVRLGVSEEMAG